MPDLTTPQPLSLYTFVTNTPAPVVRLLVELAPLISSARRVAEIFSWKSGNHAESWLAVALWWALCLSADFGIRYLLPAIVLVPLLFRTLAPRLPFFQRFAKKPSGQPPATESAISRTLADIHTIQTLLPHVPPFPSLPPPNNVLRMVSIVYIPYVLLVRLVSVKILVAIIGTCLLTWRSPWASTSREVLLRSGWVQWSIQRSWLALSGVPASASFGSTQVSTSAGAALKPAAVADSQYDLPAPAHLQFQFTVFENQRWWMGLDFTAALLPGDRPSWCSPPPGMTALPPPGSLSLPGPTTVYLPITETSGSLNPAGLRMKRTSKWKWEEPEWGVTVRTTSKDGHTHEERVKMEPPTDVDAHAGGNAARLVDVVGKGLRRAQTASGGGVNDHGSPTREESIFHRFTHDAAASPHHVADGPAKSKALPSDSDLTDMDGWVYADNKWEGGSAVRGRGKYTRYRRWTRVALLEETVEVVDSPTPDTMVLTAEQDGSPLRRRITGAGRS